MKAPELLGGRYELRGVLGRGGMAEVHDGWDTRLARPVAVKILHPGFNTQPDSRRRFEAEARAAAALNSSHIVAVHDSGDHYGMPFIVMERLTGESLHDLIMRGPLPEPLVQSVVGQVLSALASAHDAGILHRDIKPGNILFTASGVAKISDFGVAKTAENNFTAAGEVFGTMAYLSPDRVLGKPATAADDVYAVGVVGYEALTGRRPFLQDNLGALAQAILHEQPPPISLLRPDVSPALAAAMERAMSRDRAMRFPTARAMQEALQVPITPARPATRVLTGAVPPPASIAPLPTGPYRSRRNLVMVLGAVFAALLLGIVLIGLTSGESAKPQPVTNTNTSAPAPPPTSAAPPSTPPSAEQPPAPPPTKPPPGHNKPNKRGPGGEGD